VLNIGEYTLHKWGEAQTARYIDELEVCCQTLADNPALGRLCDDVRPGLRHHEHGRHVVFYRQEPKASWFRAFFINACSPKDIILDEQDDEP